MSKPLFWIKLIGLGFSLGYALIFASAVIYAAFHGWTITFSFNHFHEGIAEVIIFSLTAIFVLITYIAYLKDESSRR